MTDIGLTNRMIQLADNTIEKDELLLLCEWILSGARLTKGSLTTEFEKKISQILNVKHAVFVNSGSSANLLALYTLIATGKIGGGGIVVPAVSWVTTVTPAIQFKVPVHLCDCNTVDLGLDLNHLEFIFKTKKPSALFVVHVLGHPNDMHTLISLCDKHGVTLIEDACEALGSAYLGKMLGSFGTIGTFSFYYGHQISTIEGGILITNDDELKNIALSLRAHGWGRDVDIDVRRLWEKDYDIDEVRQLYSFYYPGFNCRSTDLNAFLGLSQLKKLPKIVKCRHDNYIKYSEKLEDDYWIQTSTHETLSNLAYGTLVENRLETYKYLQSKNIETRPLICGSIGRQPFWIKMNGLTALKNADVVHEKGIYLPNHANLTEEDIDIVVSNFRNIAIPTSNF